MAKAQELKSKQSPCHWVSTCCTSPWRPPEKPQGSAGDRGKWLTSDTFPAFIPLSHVICNAVCSERASPVSPTVLHLYTSHSEDLPRTHRTWAVHNLTHSFLDHLCCTVGSSVCRTARVHCCSKRIILRWGSEFWGLLSVPRLVGNAQPIPPPSFSFSFPRHSISLLYAANSGKQMLLSPNFPCQEYSMI